MTSHSIGLQMLENVFEEINERSPIESMTLESNSGMASPPSGARAHGGWLRKLFKRKKSVSCVL